MPERFVLRQYQSLPLKAKVSMSKARIREWYDHWDGDVYISFSGGKDSTVLAHLVHDMYPNVPMVFSNTGLEYPEVRRFAEQNGAEIIHPDMSFPDVISTYGYPIISKEISEAVSIARRIRNGSTQWRVKKGTKTTWIDSKRNEMLGKETLRKAYNKNKWLTLCTETQFKISNMCCFEMKKFPFRKFNRRKKLFPIVGTLAEESRLREQAWIRGGCNVFEGNHKSSQPMSFWTEQDVLQYIVDNNIEIASVYGDIVCTDTDGMQHAPMPGVECNLQCTGCDRTGCIYCAFGAHLKAGGDRFQKLAITHPKQYEYCMGGGQWVDNPDYDLAAPEMDGEWKNWNPKKIWVPSKKGLGMKKVFDDCNAIYGKGFIKYD